MGYCLSGSTPLQCCVTGRGPAPPRTCVAGTQIEAKVVSYHLEMSGQLPALRAQARGCRALGTTPAATTVYNIEEVKHGNTGYTFREQRDPLSAAR